MHIDYVIQGISSEKWVTFLSLHQQLDTLDTNRLPHITQFPLLAIYIPLFWPGYSCYPNQTMKVEAEKFYETQIIICLQSSCYIVKDFNLLTDEATQHEDSVLGYGQRIMYKVPTCFNRYDFNRPVKFRENYAGCGRSKKNQLTIKI